MSRVTLKEYIDQRFKDRDHALVLAAADLQRRLHAMNDLHRQIDAERGHFVSVEAFQHQHVALEEKVTALDEKVGIRILAIERWQSKIIGALALTSVLLPAVVALVVYMLTRHALPVQTK